MSANPATVDANPAKLTQSPGYLLSRVGTAIQAEFKQLLAGWELRPLHFLLLSVLTGTDGVSQQDLCRTLRIDSGNMVELLDRLEALGFARRAPDPVDRRRHVVTISDEGRRAAGAIGAATRELDRRFLSPLSKAETRQLTELLGRLYAETVEGRRQAAPLGTPAPKGGR